MEYEGLAELHAEVGEQAIDVEVSIFVIFFNSFFNLFTLFCIYSVFNLPESHYIICLWAHHFDLIEELFNEFFESFNYEFEANRVLEVNFEGQWSVRAHGLLY